MKEFVISKNEKNIRLDKFMAKVMPNIKSGEIFKALRKKKVRVNGKHKDGSICLLENDIVSIYMNDECFEVKSKSYSWQNSSTEIEIVYQDENILIANKPSGMPSQDIDGCTDSLESRIRSYLYSKGELDLSATPLFIPSLCHRIDRNTSGLVICAKNSISLRILNEKIKNREVRKFYICETENPPKPLSGKILGYLIKSEHQRKMLFSSVPSNNSQKCETLYKTIKAGTPSLVEIELLTGKTHQIRACMSHIGATLVGDVKYGAKYDGKHNFQHLTAFKIIFEFSSDADILNYLNGKAFSI